MFLNLKLYRIGVKSSKINSLDHIFYQFKDCKGLIFDIRDNGGGMLFKPPRIAFRFLEGKKITSYIQPKKG